VRVVVVRLPHISNFDDFAPLAAEPGVQISYSTSAEDVLRADLVILPGTKNTRGDLRWLRARGLDAAICNARNAGASVLGVCGGFQMLGREVADPEGAEGDPGREPGLGLLSSETAFASTKTTRRVTGTVAVDRGMLAGAAGLPVTAYEIHMGATRSSEESAFSLESEGRLDGAVSGDGRVVGTYLHGLFANDDVRRCIVANVRVATGASGRPSPAWDPDAHIDALARHVSQYLDIARIREIAGI
jgi:adenosylcobyric acid synthase